MIVQFRGIILLLLLSGSLVLAVNIHSAKSAGPIYIRADGTIDPPSANITSLGSDYYFTGDNHAEIVVERSNIRIYGMGYTLQGTGTGNGFLIENAVNVTIKLTNIRTFESGICIRSPSSGNYISLNNITDNSWWGIRVEGSENNEIYRNNIRRNQVYGIDLASRNNKVFLNNITDNYHSGMTIWTGNNTLWGNAFVENFRSFRVGGYFLSDFFNNVDTSNTIDGKPIYYWMNQQDAVVPSDAGCVILANCTRITVQNLTIINSEDGIHLAFCKDSEIAQNNVIENLFGIFVQSSSNVSVHENYVFNGEWGIYFWNSSGSIFKNSICQNDYGVHIDQAVNVSIFENNITDSYGCGIFFTFNSSNNTVFRNNLINNQYGVSIHHWCYGNRFWHNNFIDNDFPIDLYRSYSNSWDDGYPSGGNYWDGFNPPDSFGGEYQNEPGSDRIGDISFFMDENNTDRYTLIYPYGFDSSPDINQDMMIDIFDVILIASAYGSIPGDPNWDSYCDVNMDEVIDIFDLILVASHYGETYP